MTIRHVCEGPPSQQDRVEQVTCAFQCSNNQCLPTMLLVCNGRKDCPDNSDEKDCQMNSASQIDTQNTEFIQIILIVVAVTVTVAVISCIFNHYKRARNSWMERRSQRERREVPSAAFVSTLTLSLLPNPVANTTLVPSSYLGMKKVKKVGS
ncbi:LDLRAD4 [Branchiostoma lanceolatum]|uniref:LDLRAD4 protein n=1 Tax=Branchiostoma lanceolatum TaxID=7740 RepID=A0A8K0A6N0_BRALA|nr:LDLRAD4 [Branchiostoma lanceolatum]